MKIFSVLFIFIYSFVTFIPGMNSHFSDVQCVYTVKTQSDLHCHDQSQRQNETEKNHHEDCHCGCHISFANTVLLHNRDVKIFNNSYLLKASYPYHLSQSVKDYHSRLNRPPIS